MPLRLRVAYPKRTGYLAYRGGRLVLRTEPLDELYDLPLPGG